MERLTHMGRYAPKELSNTEASNLSKRGAKIFRADEPDEAHACQFLIQLLTYIKSWATHFPENNAGQNVQTFAKVYQELRNEGVSFPDEHAAVRQSNQSQASVSQRQREARGGSNPRQ